MIEEAAREILAQPIPEEFHFGASAEFKQPRCPVCSCIDITFEGASRAAALASLYVLAVPMPPGRETWLCNDCGTRWDDTGPPS